jgi:Na+/H+ antiporter NhaC
MKHKVVLFLFFVMMAAQSFSQCAMCKAVAEDTEMDSQASLNRGILYIMVMPYILLFVLFRKRIGRFLKEMKTAKG